MIRVYDGMAFESFSGERVNVTAHDLGNGHLEVSGVRETLWRELELSPLAFEHLCEAIARDKEERTEERAALSLAVAAARAKRRVRRLVKVMGADTLLTLTYRANMADLAVCKANLKEFVRRVRRVIPDFRAVCCFEEQKRGAYHVHMATVRVPRVLAYGTSKSVKSFNVLRAIWRSVTKENGGNVDVARSKSQRSPAKIAAYIAKYIAKGFADGVAGSNRWTKFGDVEVPPPVRLGAFSSITECVYAAYALIDGAATVVDQHLSRWGDWFFVVVEGQARVSPSV